MNELGEKARKFLDLHRPGEPLLLPNPWDAGSAKILESLGFEALATTSGGFAATLGRNDGNVSREEAIEHGGVIAAATTLPVSADLENGFADDLPGLAETFRRAGQAGLAGASIEDYGGVPEPVIYPLDVAVERVRVAAEAAHAAGIVLTARAENYFRGNPDLADTIARRQAYEAAGATVLYAPGRKDIDDIRAVIEAVDAPVNVLARPGAPTVPELAAAGAARISVGSGFAFAALGALVTAAEELKGPGTYEFWDGARAGGRVAHAAFTD
jgi:2-methylisocitrate lyase-like PEP mutase family enzyme